MIISKLLPDGGFVCGDTASRVTAYAYPTSIHAQGAKKNAKAVADQMIAGEMRCGIRYADSDARNWQKLEG